MFVCFALKLETSHRAQRAIICVFPPYQMHQQGILKTDDLITRFFRLCTEMCVDLCYRALADQTHSPTLVRAKCFHTLDAFVRLIALLVKHSGDTSNTVTKINLLNKVSWYAGAAYSLGVPSGTRLKAAIPPVRCLWQQS